jgi:hypothetical protein
MDTSHDHEVVSIYAYTDEQIDQLCTLAPECTLMWGTKDGWPVGVIHAFVWRDGKLWITFASHRHRASAIKRDPRVSVCISGATSQDPNCPRGAATCKGRGEFFDNDDTKAWFYRALAQKVSPDNKAGEDAFATMLDSPLRTILAVTPEKWITYDGMKAGRDMAGQLPEEEKTPMKSGDAERMNKERAKRGLPPRT